MPLAALPADPPNQNHCKKKGIMKTRTLKILAATKLLPLLLLLVLPAVAQAQYYYTNGLDIWSYTPNTGPVTITGYSYHTYSGYGDVVTIPDKINGYPVTSIGSLAFDNHLDVGSVIIPASVTSIGEDAFVYCYSLTGVYFLGNSPTPTNDLTVFSGDTPETVYYLPGTTGWGTMFDGWPTELWLPPNPVQTGNGSFGVGVKPVGFIISSSGNRVVVVEAATNLANPVWIPAGTNTLTGGTSFSTIRRGQIIPVVTTVCVRLETPDHVESEIESQFQFPACSVA